MPNFKKTESDYMRLKSIPKELPVLPLRNILTYPFSIMPLWVGIPRSQKLVADSLQGNHFIGLIAMKDPSVEEPMPDQIYQVGTASRIHRVFKTPDGQLHVIVEGMERFRIVKWLQTDPYLTAKIELIPDIIDLDIELDALKLSLRSLAQEVVTLLPNVPDEARNLLEAVEDPRYLAYIVAANARLDVVEGQKILEMDKLKDKIKTLISHLAREKEVLTLGKKIQTEAREEMDKAQREYYLRQQLKVIQKELGEVDDSESLRSDYALKLEKANLPDDAKKEAERELKRLKEMHPSSPECSVIKTYLDWLFDLPWHILSEEQVNIPYARAVLDEDHYDLQAVKERIIEYLAVRKLLKDRGIEPEPKRDETIDDAMGVILCFIGPPGVGKTSLGKSIARTLGRKFTRMSLGGMRDEAEIRGHRRTYIGAMPGRIIQAIKRAGTRNPVFMLDEIDKIGSDWRGDPGSALLEVLDPAQNHSFRDHYLDVDFDLSAVMFITTANQLETIPAPLRDRMEIIHLDGYTEYEKIKIAQEYLVPRQIKINGLLKEEVSLTEAALRKIIQYYTREAGVRTLERQIGIICRKTAVKISAGESNPIEITPDRVREYLKKELFESESSECFDIPGIATGLSVTPVGGEILFIEATRMSGKGELTITGQLGDVMHESAEIAYSYVRSNADQLNIDTDAFGKTDIHLHVPAGAIPKDGPSAGITMVMAISSLFAGRPVRSDIGMTGEITLRGRVLPVGGIKQKVLAAHRSGLKKVILPRRNERDLEELPDEIRHAIHFELIDHIGEALSAVLTPLDEGRHVR